MTPAGAGGEINGVERQVFLSRKSDKTGRKPWLEAPRLAANSGAST
jgi:hypothetical protein